MMYDGLLAVNGRAEFRLKSLRCTSLIMSKITAPPNNMRLPTITDDSCLQDELDPTGQVRSSDD